MNFFSKINIARIKKFLLVFVLIISMIFAPIQAHVANAAWGEILNSVLTYVFSMLKDMLKGLINGALKTAATQAVTKAMNNMVGGSFSSAPKFITDWKDYIIDKPKEDADKFMNDYLSQTISRGRSSASGYVKKTASNLFASNYEGVGSGSFSYGMAMSNSSFGKFSYIAQAADSSSESSDNSFDQQAIIEIAKKHTTEKDDPAPDYNGGNISDASGNFANLRSYFRGPNNQWSITADADAKYREKMAEKKAEAQAKAVANQGFTSTEKDGQTTTPGVLIKEAMANVQDLGNKELAQAQSPAEVITAVVQQLISQAIQNGIGKASAVVQKKVNDVKTKATQQINNKAKEQGVGSVFKYR